MDKAYLEVVDKNKLDGPLSISRALSRLLWIPLLLIDSNDGLMKVSLQ